MKKKTEQKKKAIEILMDALSILMIGFLMISGFVNFLFSMALAMRLNLNFSSIMSVCFSVIGTSLISYMYWKTSERLK